MCLGQFSFMHQLKIHTFIKSPITLLFWMIRTSRIEIQRVDKRISALNSLYIWYGTIYTDD